MRKPGGYAVLTAPRAHVANFDHLRHERVEEGVTEMDTFSCYHCQRVIHVRPRMDPADMGGLCKICMQLICPHCVGHGCTPWEKKLEQWEAKGRALRSYGL